MTQLNVAFVGEGRAGSTSLQRYRAFRELGHNVALVRHDPTMSNWHPLRFANRMLQYSYRRGWSDFGHLDLIGANRALIEMARSRHLDFVWLDKALTITPETLHRVKRLRPNCQILGFAADDVTVRRLHSHRLLASFPLYDAFITTKSFAVGRLNDLGSRNTHFLDNAYDPHTHRPRPQTGENRERWGGEIGFVGIYETPRADSIVRLCSKGLTVRVWGNGWQQCKRREGLTGLRLEYAPAVGDDYATAISNFDVSLCFLNKDVNDQQTTRSVEIPACGGFMLGERTDEHRRLFEEGKEAEYFATGEELLDKARFYLANEAARRRIAAAGHERCMKSGYSYRDRLAQALRLAGLQG